MSRLLTIGVDFGTTYSGVAYNHLGDVGNTISIAKDYSTNSND